MSNSTMSSTSSFDSTTPISSSTSISSSSTQDPITSSSSVPGTTTSANPTSTLPPPDTTTTTTHSTPTPTTEFITSIATPVTTQNGSQSTLPPVTVVKTITPSSTSTGGAGGAGQTTTSSTSSSPSAQGSNIDNGGSKEHSGGGGLSTGGKTAIAVVIPVVVVALLVLLGIFLWRRRKRSKADEEARRKEIQDYGYNPNNDPTLPAVASESGMDMAEDQSSGYRGWGAATASNRKASTTMSGGHTHGQLSEAGSNMYSTGRPASPTLGGINYLGDPLANTRDTMGSDDLGALGAAPLAANNQPLRRGPSNASSAYSATGRSDHSDDYPMPQNGGYGYDPSVATGGYGYSQHGPYGDGSYGGAPDAGMPVVRDVSARRNTRIQQGGQYQQENSGIAQNF